MTTERIKEIQLETAYPNNVSVQQALLKVWNECEQKRMYSEEEVISIYNEWLKFDDAQDSYNGQDDLTFVQWFKKFKKK